MQALQTSVAARGQRITMVGSGMATPQSAAFCALILIETPISF
jgi:hypothetical protein